MTDKELRRVCVQSYGHPIRDADARPPGTITWDEHVKAWQVYDRKYGGQSAERLVERGGFDYGELVDLLGHNPETWKPLGVTRILQQL